MFHSANGTTFAPGRIAIVTSWNVRCGVAEYSSFLSSAMEKLGADVRIYADRTEDLEHKDAANVRRPWRNERVGISSLIAAIVEDRPAAVVIQHHPQFYGLDVLAELVRHLSSLRLTVAVCLHLVQADWLDFHLVRESLAAAAVIQVHRDSDREYLAAAGLCNVKVIPHGISSVIPAASPDSNREPCLRLGSFGFLMPHKGYLELLAACELIRARVPSLQLEIYGSLYPNASSHAFLTRLEAYRRYLGAGTWCSLDTRFHPIDEVRSRLARCDVLVFPYQRTPESSSAAVRIGLAANRPVVCTPLAIFDDVRDVVHTTGGTDPYSIAEAIWHVLCNRPVVDGLEQRLAEYLDRHSWPAVARRLLAALRLARRAHSAAR